MLSQRSRRSGTVGVVGGRVGSVQGVPLVLEGGERQEGYMLQEARGLSN